MKNIQLTEHYLRKLRYSREPVLCNGKQQYPADYHWDKVLRGFGVRIYPSGAISYCLTYRNRGGTKKSLFFADYPSVPVSEAKEIARQYFIQIAQGVAVRLLKGAIPISFLYAIS